MTIHVVSGTTEQLPFQLRADGVLIDLTTLTVGLVLTDREGVAVSTVGKVSVVDAPHGQVSFAPAAGDFTEARMPYSSRWSLTDGSGRIGFCPNGAVPDWWMVTD